MNYRVNVNSSNTMKKGMKKSDVPTMYYTLYIESFIDP